MENMSIQPYEIKTNPENIVYNYKKEGDWVRHGGSYGYNILTYKKQGIKNSELFFHYPKILASENIGNGVIKTTLKLEQGLMFENKVGYTLDPTVMIFGNLLYDLGHAVSVLGQTFAIKEVLKQLGFHWMGENKWSRNTPVFSEYTIEEIKMIIESELN